MASLQSAPPACHYLASRGDTRTNGESEEFSNQSFRGFVPIADQLTSWQAVLGKARDSADEEC